MQRPVKPQSAGQQWLFVEALTHVIRHMSDARVFRGHHVRVPQGFLEGHVRTWGGGRHGAIVGPRAVAGCKP